MKASVLEIQQYISIHPVLRKNKEIRQKYVSLLRDFTDKLGVQNLWTKQVIRLYISKILYLGDTNDGSKIELSNLVGSFPGYNYFLLTDCLFSGCLYDKSKGKKALELISEFSGEACKDNLIRVFNAFYSMNKDEIIRRIPELEPIYKIIRNNRVFLKQENKRIIVTANMSAGKSTLLNALIGKKVSKTQMESCTAKVHYILNKAGEDGLSYEYDHDLELDATDDILMDDNEMNKTDRIQVGTRFRSLSDINRRICYIDTPGVNSSIDVEHRDVTYKEIVNGDSDLLLYVINGENAGVEDDHRHLEYIKENYHGRILFLINKVDHYERGADSISGVVEKEKAHLAEIGYVNPEVYPVSAYAGYLAKMIMFNEHLTDDEQEEYEYLARRLKNKDFSYEQYYPIDVSLMDNGGSFEAEVLLNSGILSLEKMIYGE